MKISTIFVAVALTAVTFGCSLGQRARDQATSHVVTLPLEDVVEEARFGISVIADRDDGFSAEEANRAVDSFSGAVESRDRARILAEAAPLWPSVREWARTGIDEQVASGELGLAASQLLYERLVRYDRLLEQINVPN